MSLARTPPTARRDETPPGESGSRASTPRSWELRSRNPSPHEMSYPYLDQVVQLTEEIKTNIESSRNTKTEIKNNILRATERLLKLFYRLDYDIISDTQDMKAMTAKYEERVEELQSKNNSMMMQMSQQNIETEQYNVIFALGEHAKLLKKNTKKIEELQKQIEMQTKEINKTPTYADILTGKPQTNNTLHSLIITCKDETETGEAVMSKIRNALDAKEGWTKVEKVRKGKDRKVIMGFATYEERKKAKERIDRKATDLSVEEIKNKDPLLKMRGVVASLKDEEIINALHKQNQNIFRDLKEEDDRLVVKYRRNLRNPNIKDVVISTSPQVWQRAIETGSVYIDLQKIRVEDQSPLIQCTRCLAYGHGKRFCEESKDLCSHCGGEHLKTECEAHKTGTPPKCSNCSKTGLGKTDHNSFSHECPLRKKWDTIARSTTAYC